MVAPTRDFERIIDLQQNNDNFYRYFTNPIERRIGQENRELSRITEDFKKNPEKVPSNHG